MLPLASVAVAVMNCPERSWLIGTLKERLRTFVSSYRRVLPSPKPDPSAEELMKNWMVKVCLGALFSVPFMVVVVPSIFIDDGRVTQGTRVDLRHLVPGSKALPLAALSRRYRARQAPDFARRARRH